MKVKPKEVLLTLPHITMFQTPEEIAAFACNINSLLYGKSRVKYEELGKLGGQFVGLFYLHRNDEYQFLRNQFIGLINAEEVGESPVVEEDELDDDAGGQFEEIDEAPIDRDAKICADCGGFHSGACDD